MDQHRVFVGSHGRWCAPFGPYRRGGQRDGRGMSRCCAWSSALGTCGRGHLTCSRLWGRHAHDAEVCRGRDVWLACARDGMSVCGATWRRAATRAWTG